MPDEPTFCCTCDNVQEQSRREPEYRWLCRASPRDTFPAYTSPGAITGEPFYRCRQINEWGSCELWTPRRKKESPDAQ